MVARKMFKKHQFRAAIWVLTISLRKYTLGHRNWGHFRFISPIASAFCAYSCPHDRIKHDSKIESAPLFSFIARYLLSERMKRAEKAARQGNFADFVNNRFS